jgi:hypothetical protein
MNNDQEQIIYEYPKGISEKIRFSKKEFQSREYYHVRTYVVCNVKGDSQWFPTNKGITITEAELPRFFLGVVALKDFVARDKNIPEEEIRKSMEELNKNTDMFPDFENVTFDNP